MKKLLIALMLVSGFANADEVCDATADFAKTVMVHKQNGVSFEVQKKVFDKVSRNESDAVYESFSTLIEWAYVRPMYQSEKAKENEVNNFSNDVKDTCEKAVRGHK